MLDAIKNHYGHDAAYTKAVDDCQTYVRTVIVEMHINRQLKIL